VQKEVLNILILN